MPRIGHYARTHTRACWALVLLTIPIAIAAAAGGCNILGPAMFLAAGPEKTDALFKLPVDRPTVVFIDDRSSVLPSRAIRQRIAKAAEKALLDGGAVPKGDIISSDAIAPIATGERFARPTSIADIGTAVGAHVVVYGTMDSFTLLSDGVQLSPAATMRVKVVNALDKSRMWPLDPDEWHTLNVTMTPGTLETARTTADRAALEQALADKLGLGLANVFLSHETRELNPRLGK